MLDLCMFNFFKNKFIIKNNKKANTSKIFVCKHCKLICKDCKSLYCYACFSNKNNPCPSCGKTNNDKKDSS